MTVEQLAEALHTGWQRYRELFEEIPHGTTRQLAAIIELSPGVRKILEKS